MTYSVILVEPEKFVDAVADILSLIPEARSFIASPALIAPPGHPGVDGCKAIPGVLGTAHVSDDLMRLLNGIDWSLQIATGLLPDFAVGGVPDGSPYPVIVDQPHASGAPPAVCCAVNFSLAPADFVFVSTDSLDPVNHLTRTLSGCSIPVVAAGNSHVLGSPYETVSPWAEPEWVLSVGATVDEEATREWDGSARGSLLRPDVGPDLLTWGQATTSSSLFGTSFAAATVTRMTVLAHAWLLQILANIDRVSGLPFGVPLVGAVVVDKRINLNVVAPRSLDIPALPVIATQPDAFNAITPDSLDLLRSRIGSPWTHHATRLLILAAASGTTPPEAQHLSAPSLTESRLTGFLDRLSAEGLVRILTSEPSEHSNVSGEGGVSLFQAGSTKTIFDLTDASFPLWTYDIVTNTTGQRGMV